MALGKKYKENRSENGSIPNQSACAHLAFALGPSVGAARARVMLVINGLEVKMWGMRDSAVLQGHVDDSDDLDSEESASEKEDDDEEVEQDGEDGSSDEGESEEDEVEDEEHSASSSKEDSEDESQSSCSEHSKSRSASPSPPSSTPPSPACPKIEEMQHKPMPLSPVVLPPVVAHKAPVSLGQSHAEEQQALRSAERLLSRTLVNACAEDSGGISCELCTSRTHSIDLNTSTHSPHSSHSDTCLASGPAPIRAPRLDPQAEPDSLA